MTVIGRLRGLIRKIIRPTVTATPPAPTDRPLHWTEVGTLDATHSGWFRTESGELLEGFPIRGEDHVLDVGCGDGTYIDFCARLGAEVTFIDVDAETVRRVESRLQNSPARAVHHFVSDANPLPLADACMDKIISTEVIEHVDDPSQFLRELVRVGKPGALYLLAVPDAVSEGVQKALAPPVYFQKPNHINVFTRDHFEQLVLDAGLIIEKRTCYGFYWSVWWSFFWTCEQDLSVIDHPLVTQWAQTWETLLKTRDGLRIKQALDAVMPKSQVIIARKPA